MTDQPPVSPPATAEVDSKSRLKRIATQSGTCPVCFQPTGKPASPTALSEVLVCPRCHKRTTERTSTGNGFCRACVPGGPFSDYIFGANDPVTLTQEELRAVLSPALDALARERQNWPCIHSVTKIGCAFCEWRTQFVRPLMADLAALRLRLTEAEQREQKLRDAWTPLLDFAEQNLSTLRNGTGPSLNSAFIAMRYNANKALASRPVPPAHEEQS